MSVERQKRTDWAVRAVWADYEELVVRPNEEMARAMTDYWNGRDDGPTCTLLSRQVVTTFGEWEHPS